MLYRLEGRAVVPEPDYSAYNKWFQKADRFVAKTELHGFLVSTVFIGCNLRLFETMVFECGKWDELWSGYANTWEDAEATHQRGIAYVETELV